MFTLPSLPYSLDALSPVISSKTLSYHYGKHHKAYIDKLNNLIKGKPLEERALEEIIRETATDADEEAVFNNAAQVWNHTFFWQCLSPRKTEPSRAMTDLLKDSFGSVEDFKLGFEKAANEQFGSGWAWLVQAPEGDLKIISTPNAVNPLVTGDKAILTLDVWEHAYYLDYQNRRSDFTAAVVDRLLNWEFAEECLEGKAPPPIQRPHPAASSLRH